MTSADKQREEILAEIGCVLSEILATEELQLSPKDAYLATQALERIKEHLNA
jgi:hypothetical protein